MKSKPKKILIPILLLVLTVLIFVPLPVVWDFNLINSIWELNDVKGNEYENLFNKIENMPIKFKIKFGFNWTMGGKYEGGRFGGNYLRNMLNQLYVYNALDLGSWMGFGNREISELFNHRNGWMEGCFRGKCHYRISHGILTIYSKECELHFKKAKKGIE
jgi:hypothetical protein